MENFCCCNNRFAKKSLTEKKNGREQELTGTKTSQEDRERVRALLEPERRRNSTEKGFVS